MQKLILEATQKAPRVVFDPISGILEISGRSIPENSYELYSPLINWVVNYTMQPATHTCFVFKLKYFNSSSTEYILEIFNKLDGLLAQSSQTVEVHWYYDKEDEDMLMIGADFQALVKLPIHMIENIEEDM